MSKIAYKPVSNKRLNEMINGLKPYAEICNGIAINEFSSKDLYCSLLELKKLRNTVISGNSGN